MERESQTHAFHLLLTDPNPATKDKIDKVILLRQGYGATDRVGAAGRGANRRLKRSARTKSLGTRRERVRVKVLWETAKAETT